MGAKSKSKKGPKGRKARAKAKLEQVWGEQYNEDERKASRLRTGKSRLLLDEKRGNRHSEHIKEFDPLSKNRRGIASTFESFLDRKKKYNKDEGKGRPKEEKERDGFASSDEDSSDDENSTDGTRDEISGGLNGGGSLASLLNRISGPHARNKNMTTDDEEEDEEIDEEEDDESRVEDAMESSDESETNIQHFEDENFAELNDSKMKSFVVDPYEAHFSKSTLEQPESLQSSTSATQSRLVSTLPLLKSSLEVQISGQLLNTWEYALTSIIGSSGGHPDESSEKKTNAIQNKKAWEKFALGPYQYVRQVLTSHWKSVNNTVLKHTDNRSKRNVFSAVQMAIYPAVSRYADVLITSESGQNRDEINTLLSLHVLNHVLTSRTRVQRHNRRIQDLRKKTDCGDSTSGAYDDEGDDKWRDQGYTRPKVLILLPTRGTCWSFLKQMIQLLGDAAIVDNGDRFDEEFGPLEHDEENNSEDEDVTTEARRLAVLKQKGAEWNELFGDDVNADDDFKIGISITPNFVKKSAGTKKKEKKENVGEGSSGVNVKFFAEFYHSDIIVASPIGLKISISRNNDGGDDNDSDEDEVEADVDFLSSIDICLIARSDVLLMQNWDHVNSILDSLNKQPKKTSEVDFARVRNYFLDGNGTRWRQLVIVSQFTDPHILSTFRRHATNVEGQLKIRQKVPSEDASICNVMVHVKKVFQRVACLTVSEAGANRLRYFSDHILPKLMRLKQKHTLIFVPSYFDFIAMRNLLLKREADFCCVTEYSRVSEVSRGRARFLQGRKAIMLYTGRAHFFLRHNIKGARHVLFFGLPEYADVFPAVVNMLNEGLSLTEKDGDDISRMPMSCLSLYTKFDAHPLERIVGTSHADRMIRGDKSSYLFSS